MLLARSESVLSRDIKSKISLFCSLPGDMVISAKDVDDVYEIPRSGTARRASTSGSSSTSASRRRRPSSRAGSRSCAVAARARETVRIALVGKYVKLEDAYKSVNEALAHAGSFEGCRVEIDWVDSEHLEHEDAVVDRLAGRRRRARARWLRRPRDRGKDPGREGPPASGMSRTSGSASGCRSRSASSPATSAGMPGANSTEFDPETEWPVIDLLPEQKEGP